MTKETRIGLLVGMGMIIFICILVSDMMSGGVDAPPADLRGGRGVDDAPGMENDPPVGPLADLDAGRARSGGSQAPLDAEDGTEADDTGQNHDAGRRLGGHSLSQTGEFQPDEFVNTTEPRDDGGDNASPDRDGFIFHHVQPGESPWSIAEQYYGDGQYYELIYEHNRERMPAADIVRKGVTLRIPMRHDARPTGTTDASDARPDAVGDLGSPRTGGRGLSQGESTEAPRTTVEHTIAEGETMLELAQRYYGTVEALPKLMALNEDRIADPNRIHVGQKIRVPAESRR